MLDEFDKSLEAGFEEEMSFIIQSLPSVKTHTASATTAVSIPGFAGMSQAVKLDYSTGEVSQALLIQTVSSPDKDKIETLFRLLCYLGGRPAIVFCNHREAVERNSQLLRERDLINVFYHGAMEQQERDAALCKFRNGTSNILVTTDLAARGLDIPGIRYIIHYHLPATEDVLNTAMEERQEWMPQVRLLLFYLPQKKCLPMLPVLLLR